MAHIVRVDEAFGTLAAGRGVHISSTGKGHTKQRSRTSTKKTKFLVCWGSADGGDLQSIVDEYATALAPNATF